MPLVLSGSTGIVEGNIANSAVTTPKIANGAVVAADLHDTAIQDKLGYTPANKSGETFTGTLGTSSNLVYRQLKFDNSNNTVGPSTASEDAYRHFNGWNFKNLGMFQFRAGSQYLHIRTNLTSDGLMLQALCQGYLYNNGNSFGIMGLYTYQGGIINTHIQNMGNYGFHGCYRGSGGNLCLRLGRGDSGYTEGYVTVYFHSFDAPTQNACEVIAYAQNNTSGGHF